MSQQQQEENGDQPDAEPFYPSRGPNREDMVGEYLPDQDDWVAKTVLDLNDPQAVAALKQFPRMFPEVDDLEPIIEETINEFLKGRTSIEGAGRKEYNSIFEAMFGGHKDDDTPSWAVALGVDDDD